MDNSTRSTCCDRHQKILLRGEWGGREGKGRSEEEEHKFALSPDSCHTSLKIVGEDERAGAHNILPFSDMCFRLIALPSPWWCPDRGEQTLHAKPSRTTRDCSALCFTVLLLNDTLDRTFCFGTCNVRSTLSRASRARKWEGERLGFRPWRIPIPTSALPYPHSCYSLPCTPTYALKFEIGFRLKFLNASC